MAKRQKTKDTRCFELVSMGKASFVSKSGIEKLLASVREQGMPGASSRKAQYDARKHICGQQTPYGKLVETMSFEMNGTPTTLPFQNPQAFLWYHYRNSPHYAMVVDDAMRKYPSDRPWRLIIYQDGVDPSDGLASNHSRKSTVFYWSFVELGLHALAHEHVWGTVCLVRSHDAIELAGACLVSQARFWSNFLIYSMTFGETAW